MPSLEETLPTLRDAAASQSAPASPTETVFEQGAILKALRAKVQERAGGPARTAGGGETAGKPATTNPFATDRLPRRSETRLSPRPSQTRLTAAIEPFDKPAPRPSQKGEGEGEDEAEKARQEAAAKERERAVAAARAEEAAKAKAALAAERIKWSEDTADKLSAQLDTAFAELHNRLADAITMALTPVMEEAMCAKAVSRFSASLERLMGQQNSTQPLTIRGPQELLNAFAAARGGDTAGLKLVASDESELVASVNDTTLRTTIKAWAAALAAATGSRHGQK